MKYIALLSFLLFGAVLSGYGQNIPGKAGKVYYDSAQTQLKEVFAYKKITVLNPRESSGEMKKKRVKHGPYFYYYQNGRLQISGRYKDGKKHGEWKYYSKNGKVTKIETYTNGKVTNVNNNPEQPEDKPNNADAMERRLNN